MKFHENLNKQKFSCFSQNTKKRTSRDLKEREKDRLSHL